MNDTIVAPSRIHVPLGLLITSTLALTLGFLLFLAGLIDGLAPYPAGSGSRSLVMMAIPGVLLLVAGLGLRRARKWGAAAALVATLFLLSRQVPPSTAAALVGAVLSASVLVLTLVYWRHLR